MNSSAPLSSECSLSSITSPDIEPFRSVSIRATLAAGVRVGDHKNIGENVCLFFNRVIVSFDKDNRAQRNVSVRALLSMVWMVQNT